jgi:hypothetical protein
MLELQRRVPKERVASLFYIKLSKLPNFSDLSSVIQWAGVIATLTEKDLAMLQTSFRIADLLLWTLHTATTQAQTCFD